MANVAVRTFFGLPEPVKRAVRILAIPYLLDQKIAVDLLIGAGITPLAAIELIQQVKSHRIWVQRSKNTWSIAAETRDIALSELGEEALSLKRKAITILKSNMPPCQEQNYLAYQDYQLQMVRLSLSIPEYQQEAIDTLRSFFDAAEWFNQTESARVASLYIDEHFELADKIGYPENMHKAFFMRGIHAFRQQDYQLAIKLLNIIAENQGGTAVALPDVIAAFYYLGLSYKELRRIENARDAFLKGIQATIKADQLRIILSPPVTNIKNDLSIQLQSTSHLMN